MKNQKDSKNMREKTTDAIIVAFDSAHGEDQSVLIVGRKTNGVIAEIINAFNGKEAEELYKKLTNRTK